MFLTENYFGIFFFFPFSIVFFVTSRPLFCYFYPNFFSCIADIYSFVSIDPFVKRTITKQLQIPGRSQQQFTSVPIDVFAYKSRVYRSMHTKKRKYMHKYIHISLYIDREIYMCICLIYIFI